MKKIAFFALILFMFYSSCSSGDDVLNVVEEDTVLRSIEIDDKPRIIVFGMYYPRCEGELCVEVYRFDGGVLYEDVTNQKPNRNDFFKGVFKHQVDLSSIRLDMLKLYNEVPVLILNSSRNNVLGNPGGHDRPIFYLEYNNGLNRQFWTIDSDLDNLPRELHSYIRLLGGVIDVIQETDKTF